MVFNLGTDASFGQSNAGWEQRHGGHRLSGISADIFASYEAGHKIPADDASYGKEYTITAGVFRVSNGQLHLWRTGCI